LLAPGQALVGSICDDVEYDSSVHTLSISGDFQVTKRLKLNAGILYNKAEDSWDWNFADRTALGNVVIRGGAVNVGPAYDTADQNNLIDSYSDLSYEQYQLTAGGTFNFTESFYTTASFTYDIFNMGEEYVYGDEDGTAYYGYAGIGWNF
jgi:hypothetical protein